MRDRVRKNLVVLVLVVAEVEDLERIFNLTP